MKYLALFFLAISLAAGALNWWTAKRLEVCQKGLASIEAATAPPRGVTKRLKEDLRRAGKADPAGSADDLNSWLEGRFQW